MISACLKNFAPLFPHCTAAVARFKTGTKSATDWRDTFFQVIDQFMEIDPGMRGEKTVFQSMSRAFDHFVLYDAINETSSGPLLTSEALWAFVRSHLEGITGGQGDYLTGGVTVSGLMPMRPIPFKIVYVMGMEEGRFPGRTKDSLLDLRIRKRRIGDVNQAERNRYLFLEILISVQKKLYLSYVSRDLQKDRDLVPCSVVHQLQRHVEQQILGGKPFQHQHIPIKADSTRYLATDAVTSWSDVNGQLQCDESDQCLSSLRSLGRCGRNAFIRRAEGDCALRTGFLVSCCCGTSGYDIHCQFVHWVAAAFFTGSSSRCRAISFGCR